MAQALEGPKTWFENTEGLDYRTFDIERLSDGRVLVAFGGSSLFDAAVHTAILDTRSDSLGAITTTIVPSAGLGGPSATLRRVQITAGEDGDAMLSYHFYNAVLDAPDGNFSLGTQLFDGARPRTDGPVAVNPGGVDEFTAEVFSTVALSDGGFASFFTEPGTGFVNLSNGIRMTLFDRRGELDRGPRTVIGETIVNPLANIENDPEQPTAVRLRNGNIGLLYKETLASGFPVYLFQELTEAGRKVGRPVEISQGTVRHAVDVLDNGNLLFTWFDPVPGEGHKGRILDADGDPVGRVFDLSDGVLQPYSAGTMTAVKGGFVFSWFDTANALWVAKLFDLEGKAKGNTFLLTDNAAEFSSPIGGVLRQDGGFLGFLVGVKDLAEPAVFEGQLFGTGSTLGLTRDGGRGGDRLNGAGLDDNLDGKAGRDTVNGAGGNDVVSGGTDNDILTGGAGFDTLNGDEGNDRIDGGAGVDLLFGGDGKDRIFGGEGIDRITGGGGNDILTGGAGADLFIFASDGDIADTITDFNPAEGDKIKIPAAVFGFLGFFVTVSTEENPTASGLHYNPDTHILSQDRDGVGTFYERRIIVELPGVDTLSFAEILTF